MHATLVCVSRPLTSDEIAAQLMSLPGWVGDTASLRRSIEFADFPRAITAVDQVAQIAEEMDHHPDMDIRWRTVTFTVSTHSAGGVTQLDVELAHRIDAVAASLDS
jgi:4a-hydroxytetrahydrobiopterin dehydratase